jgi:DNA-directed RNA polymerase specialized sigma24 family protein
VPTASTQIEELLIPVTSTTPLAGFAELYERHYEAVFRAALRVTGRPADAEDVLQTVFLRVLARVETSRT